LRRTFLIDRYGDIIEAMYGDAELVQIRAAIRYRDGREDMIETEVKIMTLVV